MCVKRKSCHQTFTTQPKTVHDWVWVITYTPNCSIVIIWGSASSYTLISVFFQLGKVCRPCNNKGISVGSQNKLNMIIRKRMPCSIDSFYCVCVNHKSVMTGQKSCVSENLWYRYSNNVEALQSDRFSHYCLRPSLNIFYNGPCKWWQSTDISQACKKYFVPYKTSHLHVKCHFTVKTTETSLRGQMFCAHLAMVN